MSVSVLCVAGRHQLAETQLQLALESDHKMLEHHQQNTVIVF